MIKFSPVLLSSQSPNFSKAPSLAKLTKSNAIDINGPAPGTKLAIAYSISMVPPILSPLLNL